MPWVKKGIIYKPDGSLSHSRTHAQVPFAYKHADFLRIYFSSRDENNQSRPTFIDVDHKNLAKVLYVHDRPVLDLGGPGEYDETGAMPSWFVNMPNGEVWLYYTGWNRTWNSYRLAIGLAVSRDGGLNFERYSRGPIMDRCIHNPVWAAQPCIIRENTETWRMWYIAAQKCEYIHGYPEPFYRCQSATSRDGIFWQINDVPAVNFDDFLHAVGRPSVFRKHDRYIMYYSYRHTRDYRTDRKQAYRLGYAESGDGVHWTRKDHLVGIHMSDNPHDFDYEMIGYAHYYEEAGNRYLLYNGNGFGVDGFGYALWQD
jgi:hypothetical protein